MKTLERHLGQLTYTAGATSTLQIPRNYAFRRLSFHLDANVTIAASASAGTPKDSCPAQLVSNITIRANGRDVIKSMDLETLHRLTERRHGVRPFINSLPSGYAAVTQAVDAHAFLDFSMWDCIRPIDTLLQSRGLATLEMIVTWGQPDDIMTDAFTGGTGCSVNSAILYVSAEEYVAVPAAMNFSVNKEYQIRSVIGAASDNHQIALPVGNMYRSFLIKTHSDGVNVNTILDNIQIKSGTEVFKNIRAVQLQMDNRIEFGLQLPKANDTVNRLYQEGILAGYYHLEFVRDGRLTEALDARQLSSLELVLDVNAPGTVDVIDVYPVELIAPAA